MISQELIAEAARLLVDATNPEKVILFGSYARGDADEGSDIDLLVVERGFDSKHREMVRLIEVLGPLLLPADVLVYSRDEVEEWGHLPGTFLYEALNEGQTLYEAA